MSLLKAAMFVRATVASKPIRTILRWQLYVSLALALAAGAISGKHGAISALLGGLINVTGGWVYALLTARRGAITAGETLKTALRAELSRIVLIVLQLWLVLAAYRNVEAVWFISAFVAVVLVFPLVLLVQD